MSKFTLNSNSGILKVLVNILVIVALLENVYLILFHWKKFVKCCTVHEELFYGSKMQKA